MAHCFGLIAFVIVLVALLEGAAAQTTHTVLDNQGWIIPQAGASAYTNWAATKTFMVGDTLVFNFGNYEHDVAEVTKMAYDACTTTNTIGPILLKAPANITLTTPGQHYYISTFSQHCALGHKLAINVSGSPSPSTAPPAPTTLTSSGPTAAEEPTSGGMPTRVKAVIGVSTGIGGVVFLSLLLIWKIFFSSGICHCKNDIKRPTNVEEFLESYGVALERYTYSDIKKMTNSFKETLGQGGYGSVFQGKLKRDGHLVAVKVLNESKGNGEDFINEVATIGRTNHVNVVSLLGFCSERTKRALVYEFMPNGSLERFIYNDKTSCRNSAHLGWDKLYQIALGIARGLEYLHCRCNTRILHFDIKPHNILLDQNFCPKISDFGLAKLCLKQESVVSMVGARGTMGYIAPEICCRNLGGVSHKSDVYSYGMMVLEMIGGRKNVDVTVDNTSEIYFPHWIYNHLEHDFKVEEPEVIKVEGSGETFKDETAKKMIVVALWCIQTHPVSRPSMTKVVEMLEGSYEELQMPPNPSLDPPLQFAPSAS